MVRLAAKEDDVEDWLREQIGAYLFLEALPEHACLNAAQSGVLCSARIFSKPRTLIRIYTRSKNLMSTSARIARCKNRNLVSMEPVVIPLWRISEDLDAT